MFNNPRYVSLPNPNGKRRLKQLVDDLVWERKPLDGDPVRITVKAGTISDGASVPSILWAWLPPDGNYEPIAFIHDDLYRRKVFSRFLCDALFREAMIDTGTPTWLRVLMFYAVRLFGWKHYGGK